MLTSEMILFALLALNALTFSQIEGWTYLEGALTKACFYLSVFLADKDVIVRYLLLRRGPAIDRLWR